ncbi:MAG TPA: FadR/GntR family transcriptional regulator, partial [Candidatus Acidoferrales bacterium]|nr:FadR/GntR family transcriptional regulator [Candidatus Acidoferrales bacterium]
MAGLANQFTAIKPMRASTDVIAQIRQAILSGRYQPGDRLPTERDMARQFGVSRVTVRDALRALEAAGLVQVRVGGQGGPYVAHPDVALLTESLGTHLHMHGSTFLELAEARLALETTAARLAAERATEDDLRHMEAAIDAPPGRPQGTAATSLDFHTALVRAAHNRALQAMWMATRALVQEAFDELHARQPDMADAARRAHGELYRAIKARNGDRAVIIMRAHLYEFAQR